MLDSTTTALRAASLVKRVSANANGYSGSIGRISIPMARKAYANNSIGSLKPITQEQAALVTAVKISNPQVGNSLSLPSQQEPSSDVINNTVTETGEQTASDAANKQALENATGVGGQDSLPEPEMLLAPASIDSIIDSPTAPTQQQAQASFFEKNKTTILIAVVLIIVAALFFWKR